MIYLVKNIIFPSNTYILSNEKEECLIIDPGLDDQILDKRLEELNLKPISILSTHGHFDHIAGVGFLKNKYNIPFYLHEADLKLAKSSNFLMKIANIKHKIETPIPDHLIEGKDNKLKISDFCIEVYNFPGHSNGSSIIKYKNNLFTGDIIYKKGLGFNNFPNENKEKLKESLINIFNLFSDDCIVFPGHGGSEMLGNIKKGNLELMAFLSK